MKIKPIYIFIALAALAVYFYMKSQKAPAVGTAPRNPATSRIDPSPVAPAVIEKVIKDEPLKPATGVKVRPAINPNAGVNRVKDTHLAMR